MGTKPKKSHNVFHAAVNHGVAQGRVAGDLVSDNDETQICEPGMIPQFTAQHREGLHQSGNVLLGIGAPDVQKKRIVDMVSIQHALGFRRISGVLGRLGSKAGARLAWQKIGSGRVVDNADAAGWDAQDGFNVAPGGARNRHDAIGAEQTAAQIKVPKVAAIARLVVRKDQGAHIVDGHQVGLGHPERHSIQGDMEKIGRQVCAGTRYSPAGRSRFSSPHRKRSRNSTGDR